MAGTPIHIIVDGETVAASLGQSVIEACDAAGIYIPRLCHHPELPPAGHCRVCTCRIDGRNSAACVTPAHDGMVVENDTAALNLDRRTLIDMLFVEGNHFCPSCERSGDCELQALGYRLGMTAPQLGSLWPHRAIDASHPDIFIDHNTCILCSRCIRASTMIDGKTVFGFERRGIETRISVNAGLGDGKLGDGKLSDTELAAVDRAAHVCPVACIVVKRTGYGVPYGRRRFDREPIGSDIEARHKGRGTP